MRFSDESKAKGGDEDLNFVAHVVRNTASERTHKVARKFMDDDEYAIDGRLKWHGGPVVFPVRMNFFDQVAEDRQSGGRILLYIRNPNGRFEDVVEVTRIEHGYHRSFRVERIDVSARDLIAAHTLGERIHVHKTITIETKIEKGQEP